MTEEQWVFQEPEFGDTSGPFKLLPFEAKDEEWKTIVYDSVPTTYRISSYGRVKNKNNKLMKPSIDTYNGTNFFRVRLALEEVGNKNFFIHDLVFTAFYRKLVYPEEVRMARPSGTIHVDNLELRAETQVLRPEASCYKLG